MSATRIYKVCDKRIAGVAVIDGHYREVGESKPHLVSAANQAQALGHVARSTLTVSIASQQDLIELTKAGVEVETAGVEKPE